MASRTRSKAAKSQVEAPAPSLFVLIHKTRRVLVPFPGSYMTAELSVRRVFPEIPTSERISLNTKELEACGGVLTEISAEVWPSVIKTLSSVTVLSEPRPEASNKRKRGEEAETDCDESETESEPELTESGHPRMMKGRKKHTVVINGYGAEPIKVKCNLVMSVRDVLAAMNLKSSYNHFFRMDDWRVYDHYRNRIEEENCSTPMYRLEIPNGGNIYLSQVAKGGKPVIYLFPPEGEVVDATVKLSLVPEWKLSAVYPVLPISNTENGGETIQWDVKASSDGTLLEKTTGLEVAYLFWEAEALLRSGGTLPTPSIDINSEIFDPSNPLLTPTNSALLPVSHITPYLDGALAALGLHTEARTSFITYWLPSLLKHTYVALRFLPQKVYERAAPLEVVPNPDVVVRVFMLFKGVKEEDATLEHDGGSVRNEAVKRAAENVTGWRDVVGVNDERRLDDGNLFRVVEWGGMEVPM